MMNFFASSNSILFLFLSTLFALFYGSTIAQPIHQYCVNTANYTANSTFETNLDALLSSLASNAPSNDGFFNNTIGQTLNIVYGLALCRGDVQTSQCQNCLNQAIGDIKVQCPETKSAAIWYDNCQLRYSDQNFFSFTDNSGEVTLVNTQNVSDPTRFPAFLSELLTNLINRTLNDRMFATESATFTTTEDVYSLAQCTRDLPLNQCQLCLQEARENIVGSTTRGAQVLATSCRLRFELSPFYTESIPTPPPPPPPLNSPSNPTPGGSNSNASGTIVAVVVSIVVAVVLISVVVACYLRRRKKPKKTTKDTKEISSNESLQFDFNTIKAATNNFSDANKLGKGGFGTVYKGTLIGGQEIAVKRLAISSGQGEEEFKNEITLVAKLQHRNLVRLMGYCLEGEEKILIYEYVPNASLDYFLFDSNKKVHLNWERRFKIIVGIARGLLYLHEDSRLKIIHRDMKASNILLDSGMNSKISDFGMARLFVVDQTQANTNRIAGTYGYMAPEYAMQGLISTKSDVFSFGVLLLEIISGQKNTNFYQSGYATSLIDHAWKLWNERAPLELMDPILGESYSSDEVMRCVHIALLCVQEDASERPTMSSVVLMLNSFSLTLRSPSPPPFTLSSRMSSTVNSRLSNSHTSESNKSTVTNTIQVSIKEVSATEMDPR